MGHGWRCNTVHWYLRGEHVLNGSSPMGSTTEVWGQTVMSKAYTGGEGSIRERQKGQAPGGAEGLIL